MDKKASSNTSSGSSTAAQILWAIFVVLVTLWVIAFAAHLGGGLITYLLIISMAVLLIRSAAARAKPSPARGEPKNDQAQ
jgi:4-hydroxybenzoate polyprenyltransferase